MVSQRVHTETLATLEKKKDAVIKELQARIKLFIDEGEVEDET